MHTSRLSRTARFTALLIISNLAAGVGLELTEPAAASKRVARRYRGKIIVVKRRAPMKFRSDGQFIRFLKVNKTKHVWPAAPACPKGQKACGGKCIAKKAACHAGSKRWKIRFFAFFKRKFNDVEVKVKFFDITEGKRFIAGDSIYLGSRGQPILASYMDLEAPPFAVNRKYAMYITTGRNNLLASTQFWLRGKKETYSGKVTFSDDEAKLK